ncbi:MAG: hypothetical protein GY786_00205 [Proteobacteria bacterium]|nr:hypothetical protein [Pseudomonadota bacterium]
MLKRSIGHTPPPRFLTNVKSRYCPFLSFLRRQESFRIKQLDTPASTMGWGMEFLLIHQYYRTIKNIYFIPTGADEALRYSFT